MEIGRLSICTVEFAVSNKFGYGLMDADKMVQLAEKWTTVPDQHLCYSQKFAQPTYVLAVQFSSE